MINFRSVFRSLSFALQGIRYIIKTQNNARFHLLATFLVLILSIYLHLNLTSWAIILFSVALVWITECFNTAIEKLFDLVHSDSHPIVKYGKDAAAAAVLISAILSVLLGILTLGPPLYLKILSFIR
ncbi:MAG: diacylglycerol kinase family protein [Chloroflexi bacterium]|nr:diacylglycerol kinase family protein [Chloroflexota bacterium]